MQLRHLKIEHFRGIKKLNWKIEGSYICLIGPGDSTKTTILDAIEYVLCPRWNINIDDTDFHDVDISEPIVIEVTVGNLPDELLQDNKFGLHIRGWNEDNELVDEPGDNEESVLTIKFSVDDTLEPSWRVINNRQADGIPISHRDREMLGMSRLGSFTDRHLSWSRGSALYRITETTEELPQAWISGFCRFLCVNSHPLINSR